MTASTNLALRVEHERLLPGCSAGLPQRTALLTVGVTGTASDEVFSRFCEAAPMLCPEQPLFGVGPGDWPSAFQLEPSDPVPSAEWTLGEWIVALTIALQRWAWDPVWRGCVLSAGPARLRLAIPWQRPGVLSDTVRLALRLLEMWAGPPHSVPADLAAGIRPGMDAARAEGLRPNSLRFALAAVERGIPVDVGSDHVQFGWGEAALRMDESMTGRTSFTGIWLANNKIESNRTLREAGMPVPEVELVATFEEAARVAERFGWPVVVKPVDQDQGRAVTPGVVDRPGLRHAVAAAARYSPGAIVVEKHVVGDDYRLLVVNGKMLAAARRIPAGITGDGVNSVERLVRAANADPRRGEGFHSLMKRLVLDGEALEQLALQGVPVDSVPAAGRWIPLRRVANISTGGTAVDVTAEVHPDNCRLAERAARILGLDIAGIDFLSADIGTSWRESGGVICEVNAQPGFRPHWLSDPGRDLNGEIIDLLFAGRPSRIPTAAITGTNGKGTTALMLRHIWAAAGTVAGVCTTQEVRIGAHIARTGNLSGYPGARLILNDPASEVAVIEMPRKGLIYLGHPCDRYDVAALINVQNDHLGVDGIDTAEQMAALKAEVLTRASDAVVVNADDPLCLAMLDRAGARRRILVAEYGTTGPVIEHLGAGGEAVFTAGAGEQRRIVLAAGAARTDLIPAADIPATMGGLLRFNLSNAMFAAALAWAQGVDPAVIRSALGTFTGSAEQNPGRYNFIEGFAAQVLLDYAHNPDGIAEVCRIVAALPVRGRRIVCTLHVGNRHPSHITAAAPMLAATFDRFVVSCYPEELSSVYAAGGADPVETVIGLSAQRLAEAGVDDSAMVPTPDPLDAIRAALAMGGEGDLVVLLAAPEDVLPVIDELLAETAPVTSGR